MSKALKAPCETHRPGPASRAAARLGGKVPSLDTRRLQLRGPRIYDFGAFAEILESDRAILIGGPFTRDEAWGKFTSYTGQWMLHGHGLWTVDAQTTPTAGFVLLGYDDHGCDIELSVLLSEKAEGQGYAHEAMTAVRDHALNTLKWDNIASFVDAENDRAIKLMNRLGAQLDQTAHSEEDDSETLIYRHDATTVAPQQQESA